ncbi:MAG: S8 family serine peptidase [Deltaproteobacteria bacterium]|jgi:autotransporter-associated beta strand protein|nr:S8 family serine peptidase [Deltaproteobacteria bacterium]
MTAAPRSPSPASIAAPGVPFRNGGRVPERRGGLTSRARPRQGSRDRQGGTDRSRRVPFFEAAFLAAALCAILLFPGLAAPVPGLAAPSDAPSPKYFRTDEYLAGKGLDSINAAEAYAAGYSGKGVTVGVIDTASFPGHVEFADKTSYADRYLMKIIENPPWHGVHVTGTIAASCGNGGMHGVACDADVVSIVALGGEPAEWLAGREPTQAAFETFYADFRNVTVINNSWGIPFLNLSDHDVWSVTDDAVKFISGMAGIMARLAADAGTLMVFAAGNEGRSSTVAPGALPSLVTGATVIGGPIPALYQNIFKDVGLTDEQFHALSRSVISVGAFDPAVYGQNDSRDTARIDFLSPTTNLADGSTHYTLFAPGLQIYSSVGPTAGCDDETRCYETHGGTSMAAPHVSGAAALVKEAFPWMDGKQLADTLLSTATDIADIPPFIIQNTRLPADDPDDPHEIVRTMRSVTIPENLATAETGKTYVELLDGEGDLRGIIKEHDEELGRICAGIPAHCGSLAEFKTYLELILAEGGVRNGDPGKLWAGNDKDDMIYVHIVRDDEYRSLFGMGIANAGAAVGGPAWLDANRLSDADLRTYDAAGYAMYGVDTKGHDSLWSNDIGQVLISDTRYPDRETPAPGGPNQYNSDLAAIEHVGLLKSGEGRLTLSGKNTFSGPAVVGQGEIALGLQGQPDGEASLTGDVRVLAGAVFSGNGHVEGNLTSAGTLVPGLPGAPGSVMTVGGSLVSSGTLRVFIHDDGTASMLHVFGPADVAGTAVELSGISGGAMPASSIRLIQASGITGVQALAGTSVPALQGVTLRHSYVLGSDASGLTALYAGSEALPRAKALSEGFLAGAILISRAADLVAFRAVPEAAEAARESASGRSGPRAFAAVSAGRMRHDTGSSVDMSSLTAVAGLALGADTPAGKLTVGAFLEYGSGSYDTYNSFANAAPVHGTGDVSHAGGGFLARMDFAGTGPGRSYAELSGRAGRVRNKFGAGDLRDHLGRAAGYESSAAYHGFHAGLGHVRNLTAKTALDVYARYFWTRQEGTSLALSTGDPVRFDDADSSRIRLGGRVSVAPDDRATLYLGAAWEREFDGKARAWAGGFPVDAPSLRGGTGVVELGLVLRPSPSAPLSLELGVQGHAGGRRGIAGGLQIGFEF